MTNEYYMGDIDGKVRVGQLVRMMPDGRLKTVEADEVLQELGEMLAKEFNQHDE